MKIKNINGSSKVSQKAPWPYSCWRDYWAGVVGFTFEDNKYYKCPSCGKPVLKENFDGCHVKKTSIFDNKWYIIPLCDSCNHITGEIEIDESLLVEVPSNL